MTIKTEEGRGHTLLEELDRRQNRVMLELDQLNERIKQMTAEWLGTPTTCADPGAPTSQ